MANLVSPGVSTSVSDESMFIPAAAPLVVLYFIATAAEKKRPDGIEAASGTYEHNVVRTVTSVRQSGDLYGVPRFLKDDSGRMLHGDARNEYGLLALNNYLGVASMAYVVRANVNLDDSITSIRTIWDQKITQASYVLENLINNFLNVYNGNNGYIPSDSNFKTTVTEAELLPLVAIATQELWSFSSFTQCKTDFNADHTIDPLKVYTLGYDQPSTDQFRGLAGEAAEWVTSGTGSVKTDEWTPDEAGDFLMDIADKFKYTKEFFNKTSIGANDAARRATIVTALRQTIASNEDIRSETYEYNLIACPGYFEVAQDMLGLSQDIGEEAFVIADTPFNLDPDRVVEWADTSARAKSTNIAYYYPHGMMTNLYTGEVVFAPASAMVTRTIAYSDNATELWFAPAGTTRGLVANTSYVGYVSGELGTPTTVIETALNKGQRDNLYKYFTNINPIVFFPQYGLLIWGQKTSSNAASALDRINVVRMVMYVRRQLRKNTMPYIFEPNDWITRNNVKAVVDAFLGNILVKRGLYDFATQVDMENNTPDRIDRNELYIDIALKPTKAIEFIYIPIRVVGTGAQI